MCGIVAIYNNQIKFELEEYKKIEKNQVYNLIGMVFLLFIAIMLGMVLIYYFLVFRRK